MVANWHFGRSILNGGQNRIRQHCWEKGFTGCVKNIHITHFSTISNSPGILYTPLHMQILYSLHFFSSVLSCKLYILAGGTVLF